MKDISSHRKYHYIAASAVLIVGLGLLIAGLIVPPLGVIHPSVLVALGETFTFSGAILGVDYHYSIKYYKDFLNSKSSK